MASAVNTARAIFAIAITSFRWGERPRPPPPGPVRCGCTRTSGRSCPCAGWPAPSTRRARSSPLRSPPFVGGNDPARPPPGRSDVVVHVPAVEVVLAPDGQRRQHGARDLRHCDHLLSLGGTTPPAPPRAGQMWLYTYQR